MALIQCPECGKEISDQAESCPHCGNPLRPVVIESTSKKWKTATVIAWIVFLTGTYLFLRGLGSGGWENPMTGSGFSLGLIGLIALMIAKFGSWWNHK